MTRSVWSEEEAFRRIQEHLISRYGFSQESICQRVKLRGAHIADGIVYSDPERSKPLIIIEIKQLVDSLLGKEQLKLYMMIANCVYGILSNGIEHRFYSRVGDRIMEIPNLPSIRAGPSLGRKVVMSPPKRSRQQAKKAHKKLQNKIPSETMTLAKINLRPATDISDALQDILSYIAKEEGLPFWHAYDEILKILFCKMEDEEDANKINFFITQNEALAVLEIIAADGYRFLDRIGEIFEKVKKKYPGLFNPNDTIDLSPPSQGFVIERLQMYSMRNHLYKTDYFQCYPCSA